MSFALRTGRALVAICLAAGLARGADAAPEPASDVAIRRLLEVTGAAAMSRQMSEGMLAQFRTMPGLDPRFIDRFMARMDPEELIDQLVPIYAKHVSAADIDALIAFFESETGKRFITSQPAIMQEAMQVGQQWGMRLAQETVEELRREDAGGADADDGMDGKDEPADAPADAPADEGTGNATP